uniref:nucleoside diphosphate phosphatase n=1 Tax=Lepisosteus oculatus TaxID=7918 RepID=W5NJD9_LEPOC|nr:PREDICTED: ectonucleoside triphosphate diphosphohydrolase 6 [Lepisosteus oculatus]XP_015218261.1 PREDICTED: ectonucleoside triphosphate diphosphohydrolase 6 [Lepisosteus oculatus]
MRVPKFASAFLFVACVVAYLTYVKRHVDLAKPSLFQEPPGFRSGEREGCQPASGDLNHSSLQYGIMFDAGSTGTRIHVFQFVQEVNEAPKLAHETFRAIKPGLSAYADDPDKCTAGLQELLEVAKSSVPCVLWKSTPLALKATAGLRLLPGEKATNLLDKVRETFKASPFLTGEDSVSIMDGIHEGISAWITVNFLIGSFHNPEKRTVGMLDLGGGSTQITFSPRDEKTIQTSPVGYITSFQMFNSTYTLYSHSYLGLGLMSARLAILGGTEGQPLEKDQELVSPCLAPGYRGQWEHAEAVYTVRGQKAGEPIYESCLQKVEKMLYRKVKKAEEASNMDFYAFSYYYDRAVDVGLIDEKTGGNIKMNDYIEAAKRVCSGMEVTARENPFLCLDLTYISVLLQELGFSKENIFKLARKIDNVETSWALGASFQYTAQSVERLRSV